MDREDYRKKQKEYKEIYKKSKQGTVIWESLSKTVTGEYVGRTYNEKAFKSININESQYLQEVENDKNSISSQE